MKPDTRHNGQRPDGREAINESLAAVFGWFEAAPLPENLASLIEQLEAAYRQGEAPAETRAYSGA